MTNQTCSFGDCKNPRHVTKSGNIRGYCKEHEAFASRKSRARIADGNSLHLCNDACMWAQPDSPCECGCGGVNHAKFTLNPVLAPVYHNDGSLVG